MNIRRARRWIKEAGVEKEICKLPKERLNKDKRLTNRKVGQNTVKRKLGR